MPELLHMGFEAQQRMIRSTAMLLGVVPHFGKLGFSIDRENDRIQIEDQGCSGLGQGKQLGSELIVEGDELTNGFWGEPFEKSPEGGLIGEPGEPQESKEDPVVLQDFGLVDSSQSRHDGIKKGENHVGGMIFPFALGNFYSVLESVTKTQFAAKTLKKDHSSEMSELRIVE